MQIKKGGLGHPFYFAHYLDIKAYRVRLILAQIEVEYVPN